MPERRNLRRALAHEDLHLHDQPIVDPRRHEVVSAEAFLRGREDDRRDWDVASVTATAEQNTDIFELERWVIEQACRDAARWPREGLEDLSLNVNVSAREFQNREFLPSLDRACSGAGLLCDTVSTIRSTR